MKKITALLLILILFLVSCNKKTEQTNDLTQDQNEPTVKITEEINKEPYTDENSYTDTDEPEPETKPELPKTDETVAYGTDWKEAAMSDQIPSDDENWALTGVNYEYRDGYMGVFSDGAHFDLTNRYEPGSEENFTLEFEYLTFDNGIISVGLWLYGEDCMPGDDLPGYWFTCAENHIEVNGEKYTSEKSSLPYKVTARVLASEHTIEIYLNGELKTSFDQTPEAGGGAIKLRSSGHPVYIRNVAFRLG